MVFSQKNKESLDYGIQGKFKAGVNHTENRVRSEHGHPEFETPVHMYHLAPQNGARLLPPGWTVAEAGESDQIRDVKTLKVSG